MKILFASSEAVPFAKTGGLADVAGALPKALAHAGHDVSLVLPYFRRIQAAQLGQTLPLASAGIDLNLSVGAKHVTGRVWRADMPTAGAKVYVVEQDDYFDRDGLYGEGTPFRDYPDNCERFSFFSRAVVEIARQMEPPPDIIHANDWQTGLIPALVSVEGRQSGLERTATVFTIHNMAFQGRYWHWDMLLTNLDWKFFNWRQMEYFGDLNLLKTGLVFADRLTTVSATYAQEIQTPRFGAGLHGVLSSRSADLTGILNGCDTAIWNPATDPHLSRHYDQSTLVEGKAACKAALQKRVGLPVNPAVPLLGSVSRLTGQKGFDLILGAVPRLLEGQDFQLIFVGTGEDHYEQELRALARLHPQRVATVIGYDEPLSHQMEAGLDIFLMPSAFEPCGLNQMYSLIYGTPPIVHAVGGLADSVIDAGAPESHTAGGNGFRFSHYTVEALTETILRAVASWKHQPFWRAVQRAGMSRDWSWQRSAESYLEVYQQALNAKLAGPAVSAGSGTPTVPATKLAGQVP